MPHFTEVLGSEPVRQTRVTLGLSRSASWDCASTNKCLGIKTQPSQGRTARPRDKQISKPTTHLSKVSAPGFQGISPKGDGPRHLISFQELHQLGKQDDRKQLSQAGQESQTEEKREKGMTAFFTQGKKRQSEKRKAEEALDNPVPQTEGRGP